MKRVTDQKWILVFCLAALLQGLAACQSSSKPTENSQKSNLKSTDNVDALDDVDEKNVLSSSHHEQSAQDLSPSVKPEPVPTTLTQKLQEALKNQNEQQIAKISADILAGYPNDILALNSIAMSHYRQNRMNMAKYFLNKAIKLNSQYAELHSNLGLVYLAEGEKRDAISSFKRALQVNSKDPVASANLGSIYVVERNYNKAAVLLETAYRAGFKDFKTLTNYGVTLAAQEKYSQAASAYQTALDQQPQSQETILNLAILQIVHLKKMKEGQDLLNRLKFVEIKPEWRTLIKDLEKRTQLSLQ